MGLIKDMGRCIFIIFLYLYQFKIHYSGNIFLKAVSTMDDYNIWEKDTVEIQMQCTFLESPDSS